MECCGNFNPKDVYVLTSNSTCSERRMESGFCPHCGAWVVEVCKKNWDGSWHYEKAKRKKALKLFNTYKGDIIEDMIAGRIRHGSQSNMGFRYGYNVEVKNCKGKVTEIRRYAVDFNGTKELLKQKN